MRGISKIVMTASAAAALFALSACGSTDTQRTATGAGSGALAGAVVGGPVGAVVGGGVGAVAGNSMDESLGKKTDRLTNQAANEIDERTNGSSSSTSSSHRGSSHAAMGHDRVRAIQQALNERNSGNDIAVDGKWGPGTRQALLEFQRNNGLTATGRADRETMAALNLNGRQGTTGTSGTTGGTGSTGTSGSMQNGTGTTNTDSMPNNGGMPSGGQTDNKAGSNQ